MTEAYSSPPSDIKPEHMGEWRRLRRLLAFTDKFQLLLVEYGNREYRDLLAPSFLQGVEKSGLLDLSESSGRFEDFEHRLNELARNHNPIQVLGLERMFSGDRQGDFFKELNVLRDAIADLGVSLIFWFTSPYMNVFASQAPELWSWRTTVFDFQVQETSAAALPINTDPISDQQHCPQCSEYYLFSLKACPHCGFNNPDPPNVFRARAERAHLMARHRAAREDARARGCEQRLDALEAACRQGSVVINRSAEEVTNLSRNDRQLYNTWYRKMGVTEVPEGSKWDMWRQIADNALLPGYKKDIRFAALSPDERGLVNYGPCTLVCKDAMIRHRTTFFEDNTTVFVLDETVRDLFENPPLGRRALWDDAALLAAAKLAGSIDAGTTDRDLARLVLDHGSDTAGDSMIEAHIYGPMTIKTLKKVTMKRAQNKRQRVQRKVLKERLAEIGVPLEEY